MKFEVGFNLAEFQNSFSSDEVMSKIRSSLQLIISSTKENLSIGFAKARGLGRCTRLCLKQTRVDTYYHDILLALYVLKQFRKLNLAFIL